MRLVLKDLNRRFVATVTVLWEIQLVNEATVEECVAPAQDFTGCPGDRTAACGPLESALVGLVPEITSCGGGYHLDRICGLCLSDPYLPAIIEPLTGARWVG